MNDAYINRALPSQPVFFKGQSRGSDISSKKICLRSGTG